MDRLCGFCLGPGAGEGAVLPRPQSLALLFGIATASPAALLNSSRVGIFI